MSAALSVLVPVRAPLPWTPALRAAIAIGGAVAVGFVTGMSAIGVLGGIGALWATTQDGSVPSQDRAARLAAGALAAAVGTAAGQTAVRTGDAVLVGAVMVVAAACAGLLGRRGPVGSAAALLLVLGAITGGGMRFPGPWWVGTAAVALGALAVTALSVLAGIVVPHGVEHAAVRGVRRAVGRADRASDPSSIERTRRGLFTARLRMHRLFTAAAYRGPNALALRILAEELDDFVDAALDRLDDRLAMTTGHFTTGPRTGAAPAPDLVALRAADFLDTTAIRTPVGRRNLPQWALMPLGFGTAVAIAYAVGLVLDAPRPYWVPLAVAFIFKPEAGPVFARAVNRCLGTVLGAVLAVPLTPVVRHDEFLAVVVLAGLGAIASIGSAHHFGVASFAFTTAIFVFLDLLGDHRALFGLRVLDTAIGAALALVVAVVLTGSPWRRRAVDGVRAAVYAVADFQRNASAETLGDRRRRRRVADNAVAAATAALTLAEQEPPFPDLSQERELLRRADERYRALAVASRRAAAGDRGSRAAQRPLEPGSSAVR
jgi:uncharacterized membrane protein YccC